MPIKIYWNFLPSPAMDTIVQLHELISTILELIFFDISKDVGIIFSISIHGPGYGRG